MNENKSDKNNANPAGNTNPTSNENPTSNASLLKNRDKNAWMRIKERYANELINSVIPFWENNCVDEMFGGFFTFLDRRGDVYCTDKYMWMQWRIVYEFATLFSSDFKFVENKATPQTSSNIQRDKKSADVANLEDRRRKWLEIAKSGYDFLTEYGINRNTEVSSLPEFSFYFALNRKGEPIISPYNIYSETFAAMGSAALYYATKEQKYKKSAIQSMENYLKRLNNPKGKWEKSLPARPKYLSLGHYMMLANMGLIFQEMLGIDIYNLDIEQSIDIVVNKFWNEKFGVFFENIIVEETIDNDEETIDNDEDERFDVESCDGRHLNPGHGLEACWFILEYADRKKDAELIKKVSQYIKKILRFSWDQEFGGIYYFMDVLGKPHKELTWNMKLWWVHNEALIATLYAYLLTNDEELLKWFIKIDEWTWNRFPDNKFNEWFGYLDRRGVPTHELKGGQWKTFFHLPRCLYKCAQLIDKYIK